MSDRTRIRVLHTADWHLGKNLFDRDRYDEFSAFLDWLLSAIVEHRVDAVLVAGDIFDTTSPTNRSQGLYYDFLSQVSKTGCRHVVVTAGNHDSPSFLDAPKAILKSFHIHVVGELPEDIADEVLLLKDSQGNPELIVCAVPYLRDRDIRTSEPGESLDDKERKLREGIENHYGQVAKIAQQINAGLKQPVPIVAMGHLFTAGGQTIEGDGVRNLYVGNLAHVESNIFHECFNYVALGHLHVPQMVGGSERIRFSGSPIPMGFGEANQQKLVHIIEWADGKQTVQSVAIPKFQKLVSVQGDMPTIIEKIGELKARDESVWIEVVYDGSEPVSSLREALEPTLSGSKVEGLKYSNVQKRKSILSQTSNHEKLEDLDLVEVFHKRMEFAEIPADKQAALLTTYQEVLHTLDEKDPRAQ